MDALRFTTANGSRASGSGNSGCAGDGEEALAEGGADKTGFEGVDDRENEAVEQADFAYFEPALLQDAEVKPPREVTD